MKSAIKQHPFKTGLLLIGAILLGIFIYICLPHGYTQLSALESNVNRITADGSSISEVRSGLDVLGIKYNESVQSRTGPLVQVGSEVKISADAGQQVLVSRVNTGAWQFLCSERLDVVTVFGNDGRLVNAHRTIPCLPIA